MQIERAKFSRGIFAEAWNKAAAGREKWQATYGRPFPHDILSSTFDISRVLNSLGLYAHTLARDRRGRTFSTWRRSRKRPASLFLSLSLSISVSLPLLSHFTHSPGSVSNELLSYSTVTAFLREWIPSCFFFSLFFSSFLFFHSSVSQSSSRSAYRAKQIMQAHFRRAAAR